MVNRRRSDQQDGCPSFFKVIRYPSAAHLTLPNAFVRKYLEKIPKKPTLVSTTGEHSWRMEFVKMGENYCFAHGWEELAKDVGLCSRDIVVFWLIDSLTFLVTFLGANGCEKDLPVNKTNNVNDDGGKDDDEVMADNDLCFEKVIGRKTSYMLLPIRFVKAAGLGHKDTVTVKDHKGKEWMMRIMGYKYKGLKYSLSAGWAMFRKHHRISEGDTCTFTFNKQEGVMNLTQLIKSKRPIKQETLMEEVKGTQPCYVNRNVKIEDKCSPTKKPCGGGGVKVKTEYESGPEIDAVKRKREWPRLEKYAEVKIEDGSVPEMVMGNQKRVMPPPEGPSRGGGVAVNTVPPPEKPSRDGGVAVNTVPGMESVFRCKRVVYF